MIGDPLTGGEHEGDDSVDDHHAGKGCNEVDPPEPFMNFGFEFVPSIEIEKCRGNFDEEEYPLDGPSPDIDMDEVAGGGGADEANGEPDSYPADRSEDDRKQNEKTGVYFEPCEEF